MAIGTDTASHIVLECVQCKQKYSDLKDSDTHVRETHHRVKARFQCPKCEKYFGSCQILELHLRVHGSDSEETKNDQVQMSEICNGEINTSQDIKDNIATSKNEQIISSPTQICNRKSLNMSGLSTSSPPSNITGKKIGLTKIRLEDCLRCDACSCIYIDKNDYIKHMKNFHRTDSNKRAKQKRGCRSCCKHCNCQGNHQHQNTIQQEVGNKNLFHYNIKDRWTKIVSSRLANQDVKQDIKPDPDSSASDGTSATDYSDLLSQVEVKIKTEPVDEPELPEFSG